MGRHRADRRPRPGVAGPGPALRRGGHPVVRLTVVVVPPPRRRGVRAPGDHGQAGPARRGRAQRHRPRRHPRATVRPGDMVVAVAGAHDDDVVDAMRGPAWGVETVWLGAGPASAPVPPTTCCGSTPTTPWWRPSSSCGSTTYVGAHPRVLRAHRSVDASGVRRRGVHHLLRRGTAGRGHQRRRPGRGAGAHREGQGAHRRLAHRLARAGDLVLVHAGSAIGSLEDRP